MTKTVVFVRDYHRPGRRMSEAKTVLQIMEQLARAARTMRHMPPAFRKQRMGYWPEIIRSHWEAQASAWDYEKGRWRKMGPPRITPMPRQITEMDEAIEWLTWIPGEKARVVWARAEKFGNVPQLP